MRGMDTTNIAKRISLRIEYLHLHDSQVAAECGVRPSTVRNWTSGESVPRAETLPALSRVLKCSILWILGETDRVGRPA